jgi:hypothetical protein
MHACMVAADNDEQGEYGDAQTSAGPACRQARRGRAHLFWQAVPGHMSGSVYLNCCSTLRTSAEQSRQRKQPMNSSGRTSLVRVTVPVQATCLSPIVLPLRYVKCWRDAVDA